MGNVEHICAPLTGGFRYITARSAGGNFKELNLMGYVDMQYTGPLWDNNVPPPINATNLLDISHALEAVNITQQQRTSLGVGSTDTLGKILGTIKTVLDGNITNIQSTLDENITNIQSTISQIQTAMQTKGNCGIEYGNYVGNGQIGTSSNTLRFSNVPLVVICSRYAINPAGGTSQGFLEGFIYHQGSTVTRCTYGSISANMNFTQQGNKLSWISTGQSSPEVQCNASGATYYYVALTSLST